MKRILITGGSGFIGSYLIDVLSKEAALEILNIDIAEPVEESHKRYWSETSILDKEKFIAVFNEFQPEQVIHLAARTDTEPENVLDDYKVNTEGTANVLEAIKKCNYVQRTIITSTQFVNQYQGMPAHDQDYAPHTVYGESKVITENLTRDAKLTCCWTIIRPTNIWGPRHPRYSKEFWYVLKKGGYFHPGKKPVIRSYGYVGNVADQIIRLLDIDCDKINGQVFYVGDEPVNLYDWANGFSLALNKKSVRVVPRIIVKGLAFSGDILKFLNIKFPITSSRYKSMTNSNTAPMQRTFQLLGSPKYSLQEGIDETIEWLREQDQFWKSR
jgi:GlcNAc-P-P-Und epimerase